MSYALLLLVMCALHANAMDNFSDWKNELDEDFEMKQIENRWWDEDYKSMWVKYFPKSGTWENEKLIKGRLEMNYDEHELRAGEFSIFSYEGDVKDYLPHGDGVLAIQKRPPFFEFSRYEGQFRMGQFHGYGKLINEDEQVAFEGEFENNYPCRGKSVDDKGRVYDGEFKDGMPHGKGKFMNKNGETIIEGLFGDHSVDAFENSFGIFIYDDNIYKGEFYNGLKHGKGKWMNKDAEKIFKGVWTQDRKNHGKEFFGPSGTQTFEGFFTRDSKNEPYEGSLRDENNVKFYHGEVNRDFKPHGKGFIRVPGKEDLIKGIFKHGRLLMGKMTINEQTYSGEIVDFKPHGTGTLTDKDGKDTYQGEFKNGLKDGKGCLYNNKEDTAWQGSFHNGEKLIGSGKETNICNMCFDYMLDETNVRTAGLPHKCTHIFHLTCIRKWSQTKSEYGGNANEKCPMCREYIMEFDN